MEEIELKELFSIFWQKKFDIIAIILLFIVIGGVYSYTIVEPIYTSYTTLVLTQISEDNNSDNNSSITQTDITLNSKLVPTYSELVKSKTVLREVIDGLNLDNSYENTLKSKINVSGITDTEVIKITVTDKNPNNAAIIANKIAEVFSEQIEDIYKINNIRVLDKAEENKIPSNINHSKDIIIFAFIGVVIACGYVLLANMLDNTVKTETDIEKATGLLLLVSIPDYGAERKGGRK